MQNQTITRLLLPIVLLLSCISCSYAKSDFILKISDNACQVENRTSLKKLNEKKISARELARLYKSNHVDSSVIYVSERYTEKTIIYGDNFSTRKEIVDSVTSIILKDSEGNFARFTRTKLVKEYKKNIENIGPVEIYEIEISGLANVVPNHLTLLRGKNNLGFAFLSYGVKWDKMGTNDVFYLIDRVRPDKQFKVLLKYQNCRFLPVYNEKIGGW